MKKKLLMLIFFICTFVIGLGIGVVAAASVLSDIIEENNKLFDKYVGLFRLMSRWLQLNHEGKSICNYFEKNNYKNVAIYGKGGVGEAVAKELSNSNVTLKYFIDKKADKDSDGFVVSPSSDLAEVDVIVVTPISSYGEIKRQLINKVECPVISIEDILFEL